MFWALDYLCLAAVLAAAVMVVVLPNLTAATMAVSALGTVMTLLFVVLGAPDDAHSEVVVGAIALPVLYLVAIGKARGETPEQGELGEYEETDERR